MATQLQQAKNGTITPEMQTIAAAEGVDAQELMREVAAGRLVIPANSKHIATNLEPEGIGRMLSTKVNANIGTSSIRSSIETEMEKMRVAIAAGADVIMDLSTGDKMDETREKLLEACTKPFGTVPIYQMIEGRGVDEITHELILQVIERQAKQGVDFFTIHAGLLREHIPLLAKRVGGVVSRGGALLAQWMIHHGKQNPLYELFDELCAIMAEYDVCFSLGDGLRPGAIADATDDAQIAELRVLGELTERAKELGCQVMVEGPGHVPFDQIEKNMKMQQEICNGAPFYVLGPLVTDIAPGYDHITSAIGGTEATLHGASFLCYVTPREHLGLPNAEDVRAGVIASKIAAHAGDIARGHKNASVRDRKLSTARADLNWKEHIGLSLDPVTAERMHNEACKEMEQAGIDTADYCTMCGKQWCSVRTNREIKRLVNEGQLSV